MDSNFIPNPWYSTKSRSPPPDKNLIRFPDELGLLEFARQGDCEGLRQCIAKGSLLSVIRDPHGAGALHLAVTSGSVEAVNLLLSSGAYINISDWRNATPLYYACNHDIKEGDRGDMIALLVERGADTMQQSSFSGCRPWEVVQSKEHKELIVGSKYHKRFVGIREKINQKNAPLEVKEYVGISWIKSTLHWHIHPGRENAIQNFQPMNSIIVGSPFDIEKHFTNLQQRHNQWWNILFL